MLCFHRAEEALHEFTEGDRCGAGFPQGYPRICIRPRAVVHIDLDRDDCQEIARKLDLWERLEARKSLAASTGATSVLPDAPATSPYSPAQNSFI